LCTPAATGGNAACGFVQAADKMQHLDFGISRIGSAQTSKSFLVLFFKKERLA
jgi:hypothetical protein